MILPAILFQTKLATNPSPPMQHGRHQDRFTAFATFQGEESQSRGEMKAG